MITCIRVCSHDQQSAPVISIVRTLGLCPLHILYFSRRYRGRSPSYSPADRRSRSGSSSGEASPARDKRSDRAHKYDQVGVGTWRFAVNVRPNPLLFCLWCSPRFCADCLNVPSCVGRFFPVLIETIEFSFVASSDLLKCSFRQQLMFFLAFVDFYHRTTVIWVVSRGLTSLCERSESAKFSESAKN